ncbi:hypothetical protein Mlab_0876 [Methanocorpusculum labreanum Z]|uniref:Uncharacterized protein n=1 Tax=Methanocorpusculum labreanum (strain ATCC 43576 / DSM 4855 / Z) TaxID=410358 RepID=A2SRU1_METLZ|nr:hypothetical protein [Methanocorpusculum labreanum]ABN07047.1 hypothetical protein Mlab_0876 [Methanocorpusculum labreanum Z]
MNKIVFSILMAIVAVIGAANDQRIIAVILAAAFLICTLIKISPERKILFMTATGFPLVLTSGYVLVTGLLIFFLILAITACTETPMRLNIILISLLAGAAGCIFALQISVVLPVLASGIFVIVVIYILFIREYRLKKEVKGANK